MYLRKYWFDFDDVDIKVYIFWDAEAMHEVTEYVRGHYRVVYDKVNVILAKQVEKDHISATTDHLWCQLNQRECVWYCMILPSRYPGYSVI